MSLTCMGDDRSRKLVDATLDALWHIVGRDEHMPELKRLVEGRVGPVTFAEIAAALETVDVSGKRREWHEEWEDLIETVRRAAERE